MKVLLIEDDGPCAELLGLRLNQLGFEVLTAQDADTALGLARAHRPALVLSDLKLGGEIFAGERLIRALRADPLTAGVPMVVHSVYMRDTLDMPELAPLIDAVLPKPFAFKQLRALIDDLLPMAIAS